MLLSFSENVPAANAAANAHTLRVLASVSESTIYLMGFSFIVGSLFTILMLIMLDFMRRNSGSK